jgi:hypothetical protein
MVDPPGVDPLISVTAAAREVGVDRSTLAKQVRLGVVRGHGGKVRLSEVLADRAANIDLSRSRRRDGVINSFAAIAADPEPEPDADDDEVEAEPVLVDGQAMDYADARALKERISRG